MLYRTKSYPGGLCQQSLQSTFLPDRDLAQTVRHSDPHGTSMPQKRRRFDASGYHEQKLSKDKQSRLSQPSYNSLTKPNTASLTRSKRDCLTTKESTNELAQVALIPASLYLSNKSLSYNVQRQASLQGARKLVVRDRNDEPEFDNYEALRELDFSASDSFVRWQEGKADMFSTSTSDPLEIGSSQPIPTQSVESREGTMLSKIWKKKKEKRTMGSLILLNVLAALYGSSNVANGIVSDATPWLPVSLTSLVRSTSALIFFSPALFSALRNRDMELLRAGAELGGLAFAATVVDSCNPTTGSSSSAALLFAFTVIFVPFMELCAGRRSGSRLTRFATLAAISGMGLLEEEGFGWRGISCPQIGDLWGMAVSIISALHIFRSESHSGRFDPLLLNAVQCGVLAILSLGWETLTTFDPTAFRSHDILDQIQCLPWAPLIYNGLVCFGLCSWLELHGLRSIHASTATLVYTTIPIWGAFLSFFAHHEAPAESALIGGLVIMITSIYAQITSSHNVDIMHLRKKKQESAETSSNLSSANQEGSNVSQSDRFTAAKDESTGDKRTHDSFPGALLTSQLKFPYYAAQAKRLLADLKIKLGAIKSMLLTTASSSIVTSTTGTSIPGSPGSNPGSNPGSGTAPASSNIHGANSLHGTTPTVSSVTSHIAKVDMQATQHIAPHGPSIVSPMSPAGSDFVSEALKATHTSDSTAVVVNLGTHVVTAVTAGFESALILIGSDIMLGLEEAEDAATLLERFIQVAVDNGAHTLAACMSGGATWLGGASSNFVQSAADLSRTSSGENIPSPFPSHMVEGLTDSFLHNVAPLFNHIQ